MNTREQARVSAPVGIGVPCRILKARKDRKEAAVKKYVRAQCAERDGDCRICDWENNPGDIHEGDEGHDSLPYPDDFSVNPSEWAHLNEGTRAKTRGMAPERRHTTVRSLMLCRFHHDRLDGRQRPRIVIDPMTEHGADGSLEIRTR